MSGIFINTKENYWRKAIEDDYERIYPLGNGAHGVVWLAKAKTRLEQPETATTLGNNNNDSVDSLEKEDTFDSKPVAKNQDDPPYVVIKQINAPQDGEKQYAAREIAILSEINHPNIVRCLRSMEIPCSRIVVLTLADGPDLAKLVGTGGDLSVSLARLAARHLISAVAYFHVRGK